MLLSSCVIWRYHSLEAFQAECPGGDPGLQRVIVEQLDEAIEWLQALGAPVVEPDTGNPLTVGKRFDPRGLTDALAHDVSLRAQLSEIEGPLILATGGFPGRLARDHGLALRANPWSEGDGLDLALARGGSTAGDLDEFYGRALPAGVAVAEKDYVRLSQLYGRFAEVTSEDGKKRFHGDSGWSETALVQAIARWPEGRAWYRVHEDDLNQRVRERTVGEMIEAAREAGATVRAEPPYTSVLVQASVTQTLGGLRIDDRARVVGADGLYAAGADVGGISGGGYSSGLAAALVFGRIAAEEALS
jgi:succinate dehydrogenase/fumarate reductase flavoprotein subunit